MGALQLVNFSENGNIWALFEVSPGLYGVPKNEVMFVNWKNKKWALINE